MKLNGGVAHTDAGYVRYFGVGIAMQVQGYDGFIGVGQGSNGGVKHFFLLAVVGGVIGRMVFVGFEAGGAFAIAV